MNYDTIEDLVWSIAAGQGEFTLTFAHCNYAKGREELIQQLQSECEITRLDLAPGDKNIYEKISQKIQSESPSAMMVVGLETVENLPELLRITNNQRERFRADFKFPLVLWVNDIVLGQFTELAMDFKTFGVTIYLPITPDALQLFVKQKSEQFFEIFLQSGGSQFISNAEILGQSYQQEIEATKADFARFGENMSPYIQGCLDLIRGRDEYQRHQIDEALKYYQATQESWLCCQDQDKDNEVSPLQQAVLEFHLGLAYGEKADPEAQQQAKNHLTSFIDILATQDRPDLTAKFINNLGELLLKLKQWSGLKELAGKAIDLHQKYHQFRELAQAYGFLAQVALTEQKWQLACDNANLGLSMGNAPVLAPNAIAVLAPNSPVLAPIYLLLAQGQEQLTNHDESWQNCQEALNLEIDGQPDYFIQLLQELRDLYFQHGHYLEAYKIKIEIQIRKQQYGLTAFVGAGRLKVSKTEDSSVFGRQGDIEKLVDKLCSKQNKLIIIYGESGVGKSSLVEAGLVPALQRRKLIDNRDIVVVYLRVYTNWDEELLERLGTPLSPPLFRGETGAEKAPLNKGGLGGSDLAPQAGTPLSPPLFRGEEENKAPLNKGGLGGSDLAPQAGTPLSPPLLRGETGAEKAPLSKGGLGGSDLAPQAGTPLSPPLLRGEEENKAPLNKGGLGGSANTVLDQIRAQLKNNDQNYQFTVLIFDQFEEFFFVVTDEAKRQRFFELISECLKQAYVKVVFSLREDYIYLILQGTRRLDFSTINNDVLDKEILYYIGNFGGDEAKEVMQNLTHNSQFKLEDELIKQLVEDLAKLGEVRPIEMQIVGAELQEKQIKTIEEYGKLGEQPKAKLVEQYLQDVIDDCGSEENRQLAQYVLSLLTDEHNNTRPLKTRSEIQANLTDLLANLSPINLHQQLDVVLEILVLSGLVMLLPEKVQNRYQLVHDYLVEVIRQQEGSSLRAQLQEAKAEREKEKQARLKLLKRAVAGLIVGVVGLAGLTVWAIQSAFKAQQETEKAQHQEILALSQSSKAYYLLNQDSLDALIEAIKAGVKVKQGAEKIPLETRIFSVGILQQAVYPQAMGENIQEKNRLVGHQNWVSSVTFSPDGQTIASGSWDGIIRLWSREGKLLHTLEGHQKPVSSLAFDPDGQTIASGSDDNTIKLWSREGKLLRTLNSEEGHQKPVSSLAFDPDGQTIASGSEDKTIKLWSREGKLLHTLNVNGHKDSVLSVAFSPDGQTIASGSKDKTIKLWSREGKLLHTLKSHQDWVYDVAFSPDGQTIASGSKDKTINLWRREGKLLDTLAGDQNSVYSVAFSPDGQTIASGSGDKTIKLWSREGKLLDTLAGHKGLVNSVAFSPDGQTIASGSWDKTIKLWSREGKLLDTLEGNQSLVRSVVFSPDGLVIASGSWDKTIKLWRREGKLLHTLKSHQDWVISVAFSPDGQTIASGSKDKTIKLWSREGKLLHTLSGHKGSVSSVAFSPDGQTIASGSYDNTIKLWSREGKLLHTLQSHQSWVSSVAFAPDGHMIASGSKDKTIKLWSREGKLLHTLSGHQDSVWSVAFSPDSQTIASGSEDNTIKLWSREGKLLHTLEGHQSLVRSVAFSPDGQIIASGSGDKTIKLWSREGKLLHTLEGHQDWVISVAFSPDGKTLVSASGDGKVILWNLDLDDLLVEGCNLVRDYLANSDDEQARENRRLCDGVGR
ncbi:WD40 domain-containing protein [Planktothricoides raciborskii]|uniref:Ribosome assembly protein 4 n=1 Tax=Planktothricoides raciborskii FACHB-1370 TaxID=2949576 RepID=A0ABR8E9L4_9CYAN|nr:ribosome assembly protein 4 [Planktothricoides raciborskii]MBD2543155.1 ribosome assembly protein 4 [Planktothricoides raciborskii FACHB-1370]